MSSKASLPLAAVCVWAVAIGWASCQDGGSCLKGGKPAPGPEPNLQECQLYSDNACCSADEGVKALGLSPASLDDIYWDQCGSLSPRCKGFLKRLACFYRCSPDAALWPHPSQPTAIQGAPLCLGFCQQW
ncbi:RBP protein, partial [Polyodon spathula]|nr:RBP protein [Polyodon spathula]